MQNLRALSLLVYTLHAASAQTSLPLSIRVVAIAKCKAKLHEVIPDSVFRDRSLVSLGLLDNAGEVAAAAVLHEDVEDASVAVYVAVMVAHDVLVVQVLEDVAVPASVTENDRMWCRRKRTLPPRFASCRAPSCARN